MTVLLVLGKNKAKEVLNNNAYIREPKGKGKSKGTG